MEKQTSMEWSSEEMERFNTTFLQSHSLNSSILKEYTTEWKKKFVNKYADNKQYGVSLQNLVIQIRETHPLEDSAYPTYTPESVFDMIRNHPRADPLLITEFEKILAKFKDKDTSRNGFIICNFIKNLLWFKDVLHIDPKKDCTKIFGTICLLTDGLNSYMHYTGGKHTHIGSILRIVQFIILGIPKLTRNRASKLSTFQAPIATETTNITSVTLAVFALLDMSARR